MGGARGRHVTPTCARARSRARTAPMVAEVRSATVPRRMRVCIAYDCLYPWTDGGHERDLREVAEGLSSAGHDVTYVTRRQWSEPPDVPGVRVVGVSREEPLYDEE